MQAFPTVIFDSPDLEDMGKQELSDKVEKLTGRVTALEKGAAPNSTSKGTWDRSFVVALAAFVVAAIGLPILVISWIEPHLQNDLKNDVKLEVEEQLKEPLKDLRGVSADVAEIKGQLKELNPLIQQMTLKHLHEAEKLTPKELSERLPDLKHLANIAKTENLTVKPEIVETVGKKLIEVGTADAWRTALDFLNYKSFLNVSLSLSVTNVAGPLTLWTSYSVTPPSGFAAPKFSVVGAVPREQAAHFMTIGGQDDFNKSLTLGNGLIFVEGGGVILDNMQLKNVIFRNAYIVYNGGPLMMQNVYFVNCTFDLKQQHNGQALLMAVLKPSPATTFDAS